MTPAPPDPEAPAARGTLAITAGEVRCGDILLCDGREIEVTARPRPGSYWLGPERDEGLAIDWESGSARGILFRRGEETVYRVRRASGEGAAKG